MIRLIGLFIITFTFNSPAQDVVKPRPSPLAIVSTRYKDTYLKIVYGQPHKRGRQIFGKVVPYGEIWRTGANEATEITFTKDIIVGGTLMKAGTYSLFTIPEKENWTIIFNNEPGLWGSYNYNVKLDALRLQLPVQLNTVVYEAFTMMIDQKSNQTDINIFWDNVKISIPIQFVEIKL